MPPAKAETFAISSIGGLCGRGVVPAKDHANATSVARENNMHLLREGRTSSISSLTLALLMSAVLAACGGGSGGGTANSDTVASAPSLPGAPGIAPTGGPTAEGPGGPTSADAPVTPPTAEPTSTSPAPELQAPAPTPVPSADIPAP